MRIPIKPVQIAMPARESAIALPEPRPDVSGPVEGDDVRFDVRVGVCGGLEAFQRSDGFFGGSAGDAV